MLNSNIYNVGLSTGITSPLVQNKLQRTHRKNERQDPNI
jgi:hypothetical protein